jgi:hypothetical protein
MKTTKRYRPSTWQVKPSRAYTSKQEDLDPTRECDNELDRQYWAFVRAELERGLLTRLVHESVNELIARSTF